MQATVARMAIVGLSILSLAGCQSGAGGWSWPRFGSAKNTQAYPSTAEAAKGAGAYPNQATAPNVQLPTAGATPYGVGGPSSAQAGLSYDQTNRKSQSYGAYPETATSYPSSGNPSTSAGGYAGQPATGYSEAASGYANPAASSYGAYPSTTSAATNAIAPQEGYYGAAGGSGAAASTAPNYGGYGTPPSSATKAGGYPSTSSSPSPYAAAPPTTGAYSTADAGAPKLPADYVPGGGLRTADNRAATGTRYDGGAAGSGATGTYPSGATYGPSTATSAAPSDDRYSRYGTSSPPASDANVNQSRYPNSGAVESGNSGSYPMTTPASGYPTQSAPLGPSGGASSEPRYRPGGTKDYLPSSSSLQGSAIPGSYGSSSMAVRPANYESTAGEAAAAAAKIPATDDRYQKSAGDDRYGGMPAVVTPPEVTVPAPGQ